MNSKIDIQLYESSHLQNVLSLFKLNTPDYFHPAEEADLLQYLQEYSSTYYMAYVNNLPAGACGYHYTTDNYGRISWTFIHPSFKGKGIGKALVQHCLDQMRNIEVEKVTVWTSNRSWLFYQKFGFKLKDVKKDHWAKGLDLYYMEMD